MSLEIETEEMRVRSEQVSQWIMESFGERVAFTLTMVNSTSVSISAHGPTPVLMIALVETLYKHIGRAVQEHGRDEAMAMVRDVMRNIAAREGIDITTLAGVFK